MPQGCSGYHRLTTLSACMYLKIEIHPAETTRVKTSRPFVFFFPQLDSFMFFLLVPHRSQCPVGVVMWVRLCWPRIGLLIYGNDGHTRIMAMKVIDTVCVYSSQSFLIVGCFNVVPTYFNMRTI